MSLLAGVMGFPIAHSLSPLLHRHWLSLHGIGGEYVPLAVKPEQLGAALHALPALGFRGVNLTLPHKEAALALLKDVDAAARAIGAVNLVVVDDGGQLQGRNTDAFGFQKHLEESLRRLNPEGGGRLPVGPAVICGAGGAARAVLYALRQGGVEDIRILNRGNARAETLRALAPHLKIFSYAEAGKAFADAAMLINATSAGMIGQPALALPLAALPSQAIVYDLVYRPLETQLLKEARARGLRTIDGLGMLLWQAAPSFAAFFGESPIPDDGLRQKMMAAAA